VREDSKPDYLDDIIKAQAAHLQASVGTAL
jgi:hypothetical protein